MHADTPRGTRLTLPNPPPRASAPQETTAKVPHPDARVYLIQEPTIPKYGGRPIDISPLLWWGKVGVLMERTQAASFRPAQAMVQIRTRLEAFRPDMDYIAIAGGDSLAVLMAGAALSQLGHEYFYYLRFERTRLPDGTRDPATGAYVPIYVPLTANAAGT